MGKDLLVFYPDYPYMSHNNCDEPHQDQYLFELAPHSLVVQSFDRHFLLEYFEYFVTHFSAINSIKQPAEKFRSILYIFSTSILWFKFSSLILDLIFARYLI